MGRCATGFRVLLLVRVKEKEGMQKKKERTTLRRVAQNTGLTIRCVGTAEMAKNPDEVRRP